uniref:Transposase n=1 Tax=Steinernema glaseri TaxID=37863 RepID=A0A1I7XZ70_9BILA
MCEAGDNWFYYRFIEGRCLLQYESTIETVQKVQSPTEILINNESGFPEISLDAKADKIEDKSPESNRQGEQKEPALLVKWQREKTEKQYKQDRYLVMHGRETR